MGMSRRVLDEVLYVFACVNPTNHPGIQCRLGRLPCPNVDYHTYALYSFEVAWLESRFRQFAADYKTPYTSIYPLLFQLKTDFFSKFPCNLRNPRDKKRFEGVKWHVSHIVK